MTSPAELLNALPLWAWLLVDVLAATRLTVLVTRDSLPPVKRFRDTVLFRWGESPWSELVVCPWCVGVWAAIGVLAARMLVPLVWSPVSAMLATAMLVGIIATRTAD